MEWRHEVSPDWLRARKDCLTATDVVRMIPEVKKARKLFSITGTNTLTYVLNQMSDADIVKKIDPCSFPVTIGVLAEKMSNSNIMDTTSWGAAARGHILEKDFFSRCPESWKHWDNVVVLKEVDEGLNLGFSPDGFYNIKQEDIVPSSEYKIEKESLTAYALEHGTKITPIEIKSYEPKNYLKAIHTPKEDMPEKYQLAMAGTVIGWEYIDEIVLAFYCPDFVDCEFESVVDGEHYSPPHVVSLSFGINDLIDEVRMVVDGATLAVAVAMAMGHRWGSPELSNSRFNGGVPINQREWATIDEIHDEWEQEQDRMFGGSNA